MTDRHLNHGAPRCPVDSHRAEHTEPGLHESRLMRVSEVERECHVASPLACVLDWVRNFLAASHPELGRKGAVCPFVPVSLTLDTIWMAEITEEDLTLECISKVIIRYRDLFLDTEPTAAPDMMNKAFLVVFPNLGAHGASVVDEVQFRLKREFVKLGLMLGEFHATNQSPGLRNPKFRPLRSPIPMLAIRHMVDSDLPFLLRSDYPPEDRAAYLRSYLSRLGKELSPAKFDQAMDAALEAEVEKRMAAAAGQPETHSHWHCAACKTERYPGQKT